MRNLKTRTQTFLQRILHKQKERSGFKKKLARTTYSFEKSFNPMKILNTRAQTYLKHILHKQRGPLVLDNNYSKLASVGTPRPIIDGFVNLSRAKGPRSSSTKLFEVNECRCSSTNYQWFCKFAEDQAKGKGPRSSSKKIFEVNECRCSSTNYQWFRKFVEDEASSFID